MLSTEAVHKRPSLVSELKLRRAEAVVQAGQLEPLAQQIVDALTECDTLPSSGKESADAITVDEVEASQLMWLAIERGRFYEALALCERCSLPKKHLIKACKQASSSVEAMHVLTLMGESIECKTVETLNRLLDVEPLRDYSFTLSYPDDPRLSRWAPTTFIWSHEGLRLSFHKERLLLEAFTKRLPIHNSIDVRGFHDQMLQEHLTDADCVTYLASLHCETSPFDIELPEDERPSRRLQRLLIDIPKYQWLYQRVATHADKLFMAWTGDCLALNDHFYSDPGDVELHRLRPIRSDLIKQTSQELPLMYRLFTDQ